MIARIPDERLPEGTAVLLGMVPCLTATPGVIRHAGGEQDSDTWAVLSDLLGLDGDEVERLTAQGVIGSAAATTRSKIHPGHEPRRPG